MAKTPKNGADDGNSGKGGGAQPTLDAVLEAGMAVIAERGWRATTPMAIADRLDLAGADVTRLVPSRDALLVAVTRRIDDRMLADYEMDAAASPRDRLFEALMARFDHLSDYRDGVVRLMRDLPRDPAAGLAFAPHLRHSMALILDAVGIGGHGLLGGLRAKLLGVTYLDTVRAWTQDDSPDMAKTMKHLDHRLGQLETLANSVGIRRQAPG